MSEYSGMTVLNPLTGEGFEHSGVKGMSWHEHKFGKWQKQAVYANGQPDPNAKRKTKENGKPQIKTKYVAPKSMVVSNKKSSDTDEEKPKEEKKLSRREQKKADREKVRRDRILSDPGLLYKHRKEFTKEEIDNAMKTFEWENRLLNQSSQRLQAAQNKVNSVVNIAGNSVKAYNIVAQYYNAFKPEGASEMPILKSDNKKKKDKNKKSTLQSLMEDDDDDD